MSTAEAQMRLQRAFEQLEATARRLVDRAHGEASVAQELEKVRAELDQSRRNYAELERKAEAASKRIDAAMDRLKVVLDA